ncbi:CPBP family intramembrane metalloprotease [Corynebacterium sp. 320]|uniref:CPBP family intramembrane glutamic endopeptidase n=1 Tax=Corynebacterium TaxID=1716 RepID=UPI00125CB36A|nr:MULTISPECIES: CPBP family intramembrane glutamic endopeptidase [Corynebacterium]KAB1502824.1 CPBP family intramembrane metalloprotease [Corynebacterium sp. 320]KAB1550435.1 CPBP family intramembrane metalloprotease [Corynebacterium sp. 319]KAB1554834.1 CPBP family intramembrane metalloprotease [Corynebacterium sp. 321]KAB3526487.1 CPBP family intramembrane metalloprotease [Corynebacterium sp. 250]KAB3539806.1 CPBP family intramembrane metalloprotease [Corynebacterium sp. 366]
MSELNSRAARPDDAAPAVQTAPFHHDAYVETTVPFHRVALLNERYRWWRPVLELLIAAVLYGVLSVLLFVVVYLMMDPGESGSSEDSLLPMDDMSDPVFIFFLLGSLAILIPACWFGIRLGSGRAWGFAWSVAGRVRWRLFWAGLWRMAFVFLGLFLIGRGASIADNGPDAAVLQPQALGLLIVVFTMVPAQAIAEELVFRGVLPQFLGAYVRNPWICYLVPLVLFTVAHDYNWVGLIDITVFAACMALLAHKTGGLELPMALHIANNVMVFSSGVFEVNDVNATEIPWESVLFSSGLTIVLTVFFLWNRQLKEMWEGDRTRVFLPPEHPLAPDEPLVAAPPQSVAGAALVFEPAQQGTRTAAPRGTRTAAPRGRRTQPPAGAQPAKPAAPGHSAQPEQPAQPQATQSRPLPEQQSSSE